VPVYLASWKLVFECGLKLCREITSVGLTATSKAMDYEPDIGIQAHPQILRRDQCALLVREG
jgi:hypothetical protein